jgi:endonuclease YncB( thermonuclease family)
MTRAILDSKGIGPNHHLYLDIKYKASNGDFVAIVYTYNGLNLNQALVKAGLAFANYRETSLYMSEQAAADHDGKGMWGCKPRPIVPWIWYNTNWQSKSPTGKE